MDNAPDAGGGGSGQTFGSLAAVTAGGRDVAAAVVDARTVQVSFRPRSDGSFRVVVAAPHWTGGDADATARRRCSPATRSGTTAQLGRTCAGGTTTGAASG